jgi:hypothetical protein
MLSMVVDPRSFVVDASPHSSSCYQVLRTAAGGDETC